MYVVVRCFLVWVSLILVVSPWAQAQEAKTLTPEIVESLRMVRSVSISPDGSLVAYVIHIPRSLDEKPGGAYSELWVASFEGGETRPYVTGKGNVRSPSWSPDGELLAFVTDRGKGAQVYVMRIDGGEAKPVTNSPTSVGSYRWSPDGRSIAYTATDPLTDEEKKAREAGKDQRVVDQDNRHQRIHIVDLQSGEDRVVTPPDYTVCYFNWSPGGRQFVIAAITSPNLDHWSMLKEFFVVDITTGSRRKLCDTEGKLGLPLWSPSGDKIAWDGAVDIHDSLCGNLFVVSAEGGEPLDLTPEYEGTVYSHTWLDNGTIAFVALERQDTYLYLQSASGGKPKKVTGGEHIFYSVSFSADGSCYAVSASTPTHPNELFVAETTDGSLRRITDSNPVLHDLQLGNQEVIRWTASDGLDLEGILIKPVGFQEGTRYPLVVQVHGGPEGADTDGWNAITDEWGQLLAARGFVVFMGNFRGSGGRGARFGKGDHFDLGGREFHDLLDGIDHLVEIGLVDPERVGMGGASYGGYFSALAATKYSQHFNAVVVHSGITNWHSLIGTSDTALEPVLVHWELKWYEHPARVWAGSPMAYISNARIPTLIAHGEEDRRVPISQSWELYTGLRFVGVPVEFVIYPRGGHVPVEIPHRLDFAHRSIGWFERYVKNKGNEEAK